MKIFSVCFFSFCLCLPSLVLSANSPPIESPLLPGTKIVAGDLSKNEFFILAANEKLPEPREKINIAKVSKKSFMKEHAKTQLMRDAIEQAINNANRKKHTLHFLAFHQQLKNRHLAQKTAKKLRRHLQTSLHKPHRKNEILVLHVSLYNAKQATRKPESAKVFPHYLAAR